MLPQQGSRVMCLCHRYCCDTPERDGLRETCRGLPDRPREPLVEVVLVHRDAAPLSRKETL